MCNVKHNPGSPPGKFAQGDKTVTESIDIVTERVVKYMIARGVSFATAESCTGGLLAEKFTSVPGASAVFRGGVVSYTEDVKQRVLGVKESTLAEHTVYSPQVASEMSSGVMELMGSDASAGVTGIAGPSGGTKEKPVGTVYVSVRFKDSEAVSDLRLYEGYADTDRETIRLMTAQRTFEMLEKLLKESEGM